MTELVNPAADPIEMEDSALTGPVGSQGASGSTSMRTTRPQVMTSFDQSLYDPESRAILNGTYVHMSRELLNNVITQVSRNLYQSTAGAFTAMHDNMGYDNLLASLLFQEEKLLVNNQYIYYGFVSFLDEHSNVTPKPAMKQGRAFLTTHRLLLLSAENSTGAKLSKFGDPKKLPGGYHVETTCSDTLHYISIPMGAFKSVELYASMGVKAETNIYGQKPCCFGWFGLCGMEMCLKHWLAGAPERHSYNDRYITMGVVMPPWGHRMMIQMYLNPSVSLTVAKEFVCALQSYAPAIRNLYTQASTSSTS